MRAMPSDGPCACEPQQGQPAREGSRTIVKGSRATIGVLLGAFSLVCAACLVIWGSGPVFAERLFAPDCLWDRGIGEKTDPLEVADTHLQIPYRDDGAVDSGGRFTTFAEPANFFSAPGLNCSGLVVSVCRFLFDRNWTIEEVTRDRQGNSGPNSSLGKDWDFGWDLILNLTDGTARRVVMPDAGNYDLEKADGLTLRGFDLHDEVAWHHVLSQMRQGYIYLGSISKPAHKSGYRLLHYHVVLLLPDGKGGVWLYHATRRSNVHRMNVNTQRGLARLMSQFGNSRGEAKKIVLIEAALPKLSAETETASSDSASGRSAPAGAIAEPHQAEGRSPTQVLDAPAAVVSDGDLGARTEAVAAVGKDERDGEKETGASVRPQDSSPQIVVNHLGGTVRKAFSELNTQVPKLASGDPRCIKFSFANRGPLPRQLEMVVKGPDGDLRYRGSIPADGRYLPVYYPTDFGKKPVGPLHLGQYVADVRVDGAPWVADVFEVAVPREAAPKIVRVVAPSTVQAGKTFNVKVEALNNGAESDYGGITISSPEPGGLKIKSAAPGRVYGPGSTVLSVTSDRVRTKVPMAERWIELWGENTPYDVNLKVEAGRPGTYHLYVRCALRGVNVKSSVILMDPKQADTVDQQGFPVYVHRITVQ
jgi:hypothetical protein